MFGLKPNSRKFNIKAVGDFSLTVLVPGIVRGVDPVKKELYIVTSVDLASLKNVNTLLKGSLTLPEQLLMKQVRI